MGENPILRGWWVRAEGWWWMAQTAAAQWQWPAWWWVRVEGWWSMGYWLFKSEPESFSFSDLLASPGQTTGWDGVRNYQARNFLRDQVKRGDGVLFYHSNAKPPGIAGIAEVVEPGHPDPTAFDPEDPHHDPRSREDQPTWFQVRIRAIRRVDPPIGLPALRRVPELASMELLRRGSRLSVQPVSPSEWKAILKVADSSLKTQK